jgi:hypothetical protein
LTEATRRTVEIPGEFAFDPVWAVDFSAPQRVGSYSVRAPDRTAATLQAQAMLSDGEVIVSLELMDFDDQD